MDYQVESIRKVKRILGRIANSVLRLFSLRLVPLDTYNEMEFQSKFYWNDPFLEVLGASDDLRNYVKHSKSQVRQDLFVTSELDFKKGGYFVEIGGQNGISGSNTYLLEKEFGWTGIVAEPSITQHDALHKNRNCKIETSAIWSTSDQTLKFSDLGDSGLSSLSDFLLDGLHGVTRANSNRNEYEVTTLSLEDMLVKHKAPQSIDYLSIDTEGCEYEIIEKFDFQSWEIKLITVEHNYEESKRVKINQLLSKNGYVRKYESIFHQDDWYVLEKFQTQE